MTRRRRAESEPAPSHIVQLPARRNGPLGSILWRVLLATSCIIATTVLVYVERDGYRDVTGTPLTWLDSLYYATVTLSTTGYGDITPYSEAARLMNVLVITPLRFVFLITLVGTTVEVLTRRSRDEWRAGRWRKNMSGHTVIVGFGVKGRSTVAALLDSGVDPTQIVVVDRTREGVAAANLTGCAGIVGDATTQQVLEQAKVGDADRVVVATGRDDTAVLVTLTARRLAPRATIVAAARENQNIDVLRQSGADTVIATSESAGRMLALSLTSPTAGHLVADLLEPVEGLEIVERAITPAELGVEPQSLAKNSDVVLAVVRGGEVHRFDQAHVGVLQLGDRIVVVRPVREAPVPH